MEVDGSDSNIPDSDKPGPSAGCSQLKGKSTLADSAAAAQSPAGHQGGRASGSASSISETSSAPKNSSMPVGTGFKGSMYV